MTDLISAIATFAESVTAMKGLVHPLVRLHDLDEGPGCFEVKDYRHLKIDASADWLFVASRVSGGCSQDTGRSKLPDR